MERKLTNPVITQTEIIARAIGSVESEIQEWEERAAGRPEAQAAVAEMTRPLRNKLEALRILYLYQTGTEYT